MIDATKAIAALARLREKCEVRGCYGTMRVVAVDKDFTTREWACDRGAHVTVELKDGTKRTDANMKNQGGPK